MSVIIQVIEKSKSKQVSEYIDIMKKLNNIMWAIEQCKNRMFIHEFINGDE